MAPTLRLIHSLLPHVQAASPYQLAPPGELGRVLGDMVGEIPSSVSEDVLLTWQSTYSIATQAFLLHLAHTRTGGLAAEHIAAIEAWLGRAPGPVLDTLGAAYDGTLFAKDDPSRLLVRALMTEMVPIFRDPYVREAIKTG